MLVLKFARELIWSDLKKIEAPSNALRTIQKVHGSKFTLESIRNAHRHDLPSPKFKSINPYGKIQKQLEDGRVFLMNTHTQAPALKTLELLENDDVNWSLRGHQSSTYQISMRGIISRVQKPKLYSVLRDEPAAPKDDKPQKDEPVYEYHKVLLEVEGSNNRPLPKKHNVTLMANNTTKSSRIVKQSKNVIDDPFSRKFRTEKGDTFKVYVVPDVHNELMNQVNKIGDLARCESDGLISALKETGQETDGEGTILHHFKYVVSNNFVEIELLDEDDNPEAFEKYKVYNLNGKLLASGSLDEHGCATIEHIPVDEVKVIFDEFDMNAVKPE